MKKKNPSLNLPIPKGSSDLDEIKRKIMSSSALNGGFDTLLYKIDKIEQSQGQLVSKVDKIHDAIYDPTEGIFSKLSEYKLENTNKINEVTQDINELHIWKDLKTKEEFKSEQFEDKTKETIMKIENSVETLVRSKNSTSAFVKWLMFALGGGIMTLIGKWIEAKFR
jgi:hypothetical protein